MLVFLQFQKSFADYDTEFDVLVIEDDIGKLIAEYTVKDLRQTFTIHTLETATPWSKKGEKTRFRGPYVKDILAKHGLDKNDTIEVQAFNEFITLIYQTEIDDYEPILAIEQQCREQDRKEKLCKEGQEYRPLTIDDLGPLYIVWPLERLPNIYVPARNSVWVWFVVALRPGPAS